MPEISSMLGHDDMTHPVNSNVGIVVVNVEWSWRRHTDQDPHDEKEDRGRQGDLTLDEIHLFTLAPHIEQWPKTHILQVRPLLHLLREAHTEKVPHVLNEPGEPGNMTSIRSLV
jgi:hypothetical protein